MISWGDGLLTSHINIFLLFEDWCLQWSNCEQSSLSKGLSGHCPISPTVDEGN